MTRKQGLWVTIGIGVLLVYLGTATGVVRGANPLLLSLVFAIGPVAVIGVLRLIATLGPDVRPDMLRLCRSFLVPAFIVFTVMVVVQQLSVLQFKGLYAAASDATETKVLHLVFAGVNQIQLGLDVAFDIFYCGGVIILATALYRHPAFGRLVGGLGIASGVGLLVLNLLAFPFIPSESGLVDLGPVTGVWWLLVIGLQIRRHRQGPTALASV